MIFAKTCQNGSAKKFWKTDFNLLDNIVQKYFLHTVTFCKMRVVKNPAPFYFFRFATTSCHYFSSSVVFIFIYSIGIIFVVVVELLVQVQAAIPRCTNLLCQICKVIRFQSSYKTSRKPRPFELLGTGGMACLLGTGTQLEDFVCTLRSLTNQDRNRDTNPSHCFSRHLFWFEQTCFWMFIFIHHVICKCFFTHINPMFLVFPGATQIRSPCCFRAEAVTEDAVFEKPPTQSF